MGEFEQQIGLKGHNILPSKSEMGMEMAIDLVTGIGFGLQILGMGMNMFGGSQKDSAAQDAADAQAEYAAEMHDFNWQQTQEQYEWSKYQTEVAKKNEANVRTYKEQVALQDWARGMKIQDFNYASQVEAYNRSQQQYAQDLDFNTMSAQIALEDQQRWLDQTTLDLDYQLSDINVEERQAKSLSLLNLSKLANDYNIQSSELQHLFSTEKQLLKLQLDEKQASAKFKGTAAEVSKLNAIGKARARGQAGRSTRKNIQGIISQASLDKASLIDSMTKVGSSQRLQQEMATNKYYYNELKARQSKNINTLLETTKQDFTQEALDLGKHKVGSSRYYVGKEDEANLLKIEHDKYAADIAADNRRISKPTKPPAIPKPYKLPETIYTVPPQPKEPPSPQGAPNLGSPNTWGAIGNTLVQGASMIASLPTSNTMPAPTPTPSSGGLTPSSIAQSAP